MEQLKEWIDRTLGKNEQLEKLRSDLNSAAESAIISVRTGVATMQELSNEAQTGAKDMATQLEQEYKQYEDLAFKKMKEGVQYSMGKPMESLAVVAAVGLVSSRGFRRLAYWNTVGRFQSEESMLVNAEKRVKDMKQSVELLKNESRKLEERARLAEEEMVRGQSKLRAAGGQIQWLVRSAMKSEAQAKQLVDSLKEMPGREPVRLRAEVASIIAEGKQQRFGLEKYGRRIVNWGL